MKTVAEPSGSDCLRQVAALPLTVDLDGVPRILLLTSRETRRWIIPKGWPMKGRKRFEAAAHEALEEAGLVGQARKKSIGRYSYAKRRGASADLCRVDVFLLQVERQLETWREKGQREMRWVTFGEAIALVEEPGLVSFLKAFARQWSGDPDSFGRGSGTCGMHDTDPGDHDARDG